METKANSFLLIWPALLAASPKAYEPFRDMPEETKILRHQWRPAMLEITYRPNGSRILREPFYLQYAEHPQKLLRTVAFAHHWKNEVEGEVSRARIDFLDSGRRSRVRNAFVWEV